MAGTRNKGRAWGTETVADHASAGATEPHSKSKGAQTRAALIETTVDLFQRQGFAATGLNQIVAESGQPKGSLYFHFPGGKEELGVAAVQCGAMQVADLLTAAIASAKTPQDLLSNAAGLFAAELEASEFTKGCPVSTIALEATDETPGLKQACAHAYQIWLKMIENAFVEMGMKSNVAPRRARLALSALEGALLLARTERDPAPLREIVEDLTPLFKG